MVGPVMTAHPAIDPERDMLVATKMRVPRPRPGWVPRPRLLELLRAGAGRELVLVCGPAGFGKSSLLAEWVRSDRRAAVAWLSLDEGDNDPVRFWRYVVAALDRVQPGVAEHAGPLLGGPASTTCTAAVTALVNELAGVPDEVVLVVDDYHLIQAAEVHRSLEFLLDHLPPSLRLVLASRSDPPLPLARLRARGQLAELRAAELRFTLDETAGLLRGATGRDLPDRVVAALGECTEGWVAGLQLAALSLLGRGDSADIAGFVAEFSGSHRYVLDYLAEEVLDRQGEQLRTFLLETSVLERLSGPLCDAVLGRGGSQQLLESVERANLFLIPLDEARQWWRYHHLFADLLQARLLHQHPARVPELHRAAADWHERHGLTEDAIRHALATGDTARAAQLIEGYLQAQVLRRDEGATLVRLLTALPAEVVHRRPLLALGQAVVALRRGRLDEVEPLLTLTEQAYARAPERPYEASIDRRSSTLGNIPAAVAVARADLARLRGDSARAGALARAALTHITDEDERLASLARYQVAVADWLAGQLGQAERALVGIVSERIASEECHLALRGGFDLGAVQQAQGRLGAALRTYQRGLEVAARSGSPPSAGMARVGLAAVLYERDELVVATEQAVAGVEQCRRIVYASPLVTGLLTLARIRQAEGDRLGALTAIDEAEGVMPQVVDLRNSLPALRARLALTNGNLAEAAGWVRGLGLSIDDLPAYYREPEYLVLARVLLAQQHPGPALALLERWRVLALTQGRTGSLIALHVLAALAHAAQGDEPAALAALAQALTLAAPEGYIRVFVDEGAPLGALLRELMVGRRLEQLAGAHTVAGQFLTRLAAAFDRHGTPVLLRARRGAVTMPGLVEPLSAREQEVLALLATGNPNRAIAEQLVITLDTVKRHVSHVFNKLGVANRTQAATRARQLGLLS